jgi:regulatory protein
MAGTITALVVQKRNKERINVYLDGEFAFGVAASAAMGLRKGQALSDEEIARLKALDQIEKAYQRALNFLSYRPRSMAEVQRNLRKKDVPEDVIEQIVERLERIGLLDDEEFARYWIENRQQFKPRSARALRYELRQKGIPEVVIEGALDDFDDENAAYRAAQARASRYANGDERTFRQRLGDFLARRGFDYGTSRDVLGRLWEELNNPGHEHATEEE